MSTFTKTSEKININTYLEVLLVICLILAIYFLWSYINAIKDLNKWRTIDDEMKKCGDNNVQCKKKVFYKYGEDKEYENAVKYCYDLYKDKCTLSK